MNLTKGYIIAIEAKSYLSQNKKKFQKHSSLSKGLSQLKESLDTFERKAMDLKNDWTFIRILYGSQMDAGLTLCSRCRQFIITESDGPFCGHIKNILENNINTKDWTFAQDFYKLVLTGMRV